jgi:hypothetical protein
MTIYNPVSDHKDLVDVRSGNDSFGGYGSYTTITVSPAMPDTDYRVTITPTEDATEVGDVWISDKATNSFRVNNSGIGTSAFNWAVEGY